MTNIPAFPAAHNGVPDRLKESATTWKDSYYALKTKKTPDPRDGEVPVLPPGMSREAFGVAMKELKGTLGDANLVLNDKPLDNGWYGNMNPFKYTII